MSITTSMVMEEGFETLGRLIRARLKAFTQQQDWEPLPFDCTQWSKILMANLPVKKVSPEEIMVLTLALAPYVRPHFLDQVIQEIYPRGGEFPHLGGLRGKNHRGFLPTGETALFLLSGENLAYRFQLQEIFSSEHWLAKKQILRLAEPEKNEPPLSGQLLLDREWVEKITCGRVSKPAYSSTFPAMLLETQMEWEDLVLPDSTMHHIEDILMWLQHQHTLMQTLGMGRKLKPGYRALFHGPPGTGKTLTASLLGKSTQRDVFRVDLSTVVSKYIGETEKNLAHLFNRAENKDWLLFFDEADALFGKRTQVQNAHDRYANQEVAYLLQRIESYGGLVILASNFKSNIDDAFIRRFQSIIHFPIPKPANDWSYGKKPFPTNCHLQKGCPSNI